MNYFEEASLRLKQELLLNQDKEIADVLGLTPRAWAGRKERSAFPEKELLALTALRPDLKLDVNYILKGQRTSDKVAAMRHKLPHRLREVRGSRSIEAFAKLAGCSVLEWAQIEAGEKQPGADLLMRVANAHPALDAMWVMGAEPQQLQGELDALEAILVSNYRNAGAHGQDALRVLAAHYATSAAPAAPVADFEIDLVKDYKPNTVKRCKT